MPRVIKKKKFYFISEYILLIPVKVVNRADVQFMLACPVI